MATSYPSGKGAGRERRKEETKQGKERGEEGGRENGEGETNLGTVLIKELVLSKDKGTKLKGKDRGICSHNVGFSSGGSV